MIGTLVNTGVIVAASAVGLLVHKRISPKITDIVFQVLGLVTIAIGISMSLAMKNTLFVVISLTVGAVIGQWIDINKYLERFSRWLQKISKGQAADNKDAKGRFTEGFVTATMLFCVGSMAILGAIEDGMGDTPNLLYTKSMLDAVSSIILASAFGAGVMFAAIPLLIYQGGITLLTGYIVTLLCQTVMSDLTGVGGVLIIALGINLLKIKEINVVNMLPALLIIVPLSYFFG